MKKQDVIEEKWDYLIVLDACRYDYFKEVYDKYLDGKLEKRNSRAGGTPEWLSKTFTEMYKDVAYYSANVHVNSKGKSLKDCTQSDKFEWNAVEHFGYINDLWLNSWSDEWNTAMPKDVVDTVLESPKLDRNIVHFIQPHLPYIHPEYKVEFTWNKKSRIQESYTEESERLNIFQRTRNFVFYDVLRKFVKNRKRRWMLRKYFASPMSHFEEIYQAGQLDRVEEFYEYSLRVALGEAKKLINNINGKIVITADHGECFGKDNIWGHQNFNHCNTLVEVPWLEVENE